LAAAKPPKNHPTNFISYRITPANGDVREEQGSRGKNLISHFSCPCYHFHCHGGEERGAERDQGKSSRAGNATHRRSRPKDENEIGGEGKTVALSGQKEKSLLTLRKYLRNFLLLFELEKGRGFFLENVQQVALF